ncbi:major facilitator superfamily domain-containing protein [Mycena vitilis]|nr:major facilitator superfamily domain-containing protein [Mycena vitilis]
MYTRIRCSLPVWHLSLCSLPISSPCNFSHGHCGRICLAIPRLAIFLCVMLSQFLTALELSVVSTALPTIVNALHGAQFVWIGSAYTLCSTAFVPLSGSLAEIFGRKFLMFGSIVIFAGGSALCGAATTMNFLIAGRAVQGLGAGGVASLCHIILSDLVPLKDRGVFNGLIAISYTIANGIGPVVGGSLAQKGQWRWIFYLNIPICGLTGFLVLMFLNLRTPPGTFSEKFRKIDFIGNAIVAGATTSLMIGLTWGGVQYPWNSPRILVTLILGCVGLGVFLWYEFTFPKNPIVPRGLLVTRTAVSGFIQTSILFIVLICMLYYMPVYFQACMDASPIASGVDIFGLAFSVAPSALIVGLSIARSHQYRPQIWLSWSLVVIGTGLFTTLHADSTRAKAIGLQIIPGSGLGMMTAAVFFPILAPLPVDSNAHAIALYTFFRNFANILGVTLGGTVLQNELQKRLPEAFSLQFPQGTAIAYSIIPLIPSLDEPLKNEIRVAFAESLRVVWQVLIGIAGAGLLASLAMKRLPLHTEVDQKWGIDKEKELMANETSASSSVQNVDTV